MTSHDLKNLSRTLGDLLVDLDKLVQEFVVATQQPSLDWDKLNTLGYQICDLSQWIHLELSAQRQRQAKLSAQACSLMKQFADAGKALEARMGEEVLERIVSDLKSYIHHVGRRVALVAEMDKRWEASSANDLSSQLV